MFNKNLTLYLQREHHGLYSNSTKVKKINNDKLLKHFKSIKLSKNDVAVIECKYNGIYYPFFDLDQNEKLKLFQKIYEDVPYILFSSSPGHFWAIIDKGYPNFKQIKNICNWNACNDENYRLFSLSFNKQFIRGIFENKDRKPNLIFSNKEFVFSKNFIKFIDELKNWWKTTGLELSCLKFKNSDLILIYNRKQKLKNINL